MKRVYISGGGVGGGGMCGGSAQKRYLFQVSGVWKGTDFTSWSIWNRGTQREYGSNHLNIALLNVF